MSSIKDSETLLSSRVFYSVGFAVIANVGVLSDTGTIKCGFFTENDFIFCCKCRSSSAIPSIETLFFDDFSGRFVNLAISSSNNAGKYNLLK